MVLAESNHVNWSNPSKNRIFTGFRLKKLQKSLYLFLNLVFLKKVSKVSLFDGMLSSHYRVVALLVDAMFKKLSHAQLWLYITGTNDILATGISDITIITNITDSILVCTSTTKWTFADSFFLMFLTTLTSSLLSLTSQLWPYTVPPIWKSVQLSTNKLSISISNTNFILLRHHLHCTFYLHKIEM